MAVAVVHPIGASNRKPGPLTTGFPDGLAYPVTLDLERGLEVANWRPLVNWLLAIPPWIVLYFLGSGPGNVRYARDFASRRVLRGGATTQSRFYAVESTPTLTGARADHRRPMSPAEIETFAAAVAVAVGAIAGAAPTDPFVEAVAADLKAHRGSGLVVAGESQPPPVHALAHAINEALGNAGNTVTYSAPVVGGPTDQAAAFAELAEEMEADGSTFVVVSNLVFTAPADLAFVKALGKVDLRIHLGLYDDETSRLCHWHVAAAHPLEAWSDARAYDGTVTILQPLIAPLFSGKSAHELLAAFSDQPEKTGHDIVKEYRTMGAGPAGLAQGPSMACRAAPRPRR